MDDSTNLFRSPGWVTTCPVTMEDIWGEEECSIGHWTNITQKPVPFQAEIVVIPRNRTVMFWMLLVTSPSSGEGAFPQKLMANRRNTAVMGEMKRNKNFVTKQELASGTRKKKPGESDDFLEVQSRLLISNGDE